MNFKFWKRKPGESKASRTAVALALEAIGGAVWSDKNYENFAKETYMKNVIAFACIDKIAKAVSSVPWKLYQQKTSGQEEVMDHYFNKLLVRPNPEMSFMMLTYGHISYIALAGNAFLEKIDVETGPNRGEIRELWNLRPDRMKLKIDEKSGVKTGYIYCINGREIEYEVDPVTMRSPILHMKTFNPINEFWGMAATEPAARKVDTANSMDEWNKNLMDNSARPGLLYHFKDTLTDEQWKTVTNRLKQQVEGKTNAGRTKIIEGADSVTPYGFSPSELDWINSNLELARSICIVWGVPPQLIGIPDANTYSNYQEARTAFWEETVIFWLNLYQQELDMWLFPEEDLTLNYCLDDVPAMQYKRDLKWKRANETTFLTENEKRELVGYEPIEGGDVVLKPANLIPLGMDVEQELEDEEDDIEDEEDEARTALLSQGYSEEEINKMMGEL